MPGWCSKQLAFYGLVFAGVVMVGIITVAQTGKEEKRLPTILWWNRLFKEHSHRIYFHETSGKDSLNLRQTCAVESAAKHNPSRSVQVFMQTQYPTWPWLEILSTYTNVVIFLTDPRTYFAGSPLEGWYQEGVWKLGPYQNEHFSDYMRMMSLHHEGGLYMDLDFITLKPLNSNVLWNFFPIQDGSTLTGSIFHFEQNHWMIDHIIQRLAEKYDPKIFAAYGPTLITQVMEKQCGFKMNDINSNTCEDVKLTPVNYFFPIPWPNWKTYFENATSETLSLLADSYAVHVWNFLSKKGDLQLDSNQLYATLILKNCPMTAKHAERFPDHK